CQGCCPCTRPAYLCWRLA
ncbi:hypothetical protein EE612_058525, partial [Oryza sativa]